MGFHAYSKAHRYLSMPDISLQELIALRLASQRIPSLSLVDSPDMAGFQRVDQAVQWFGAVQAQEYVHAKWAVALRFPAAAPVTHADVEQALARRTVVRTWALRGTLHLVAAADVRWLLALAAPALLTRTAAVYRQKGLDEAGFEKIFPAIRQSLQGGQQLMRAELFAALGQHRIATQGQRGAHILYRAAQVGLLCLGTPRDKQSTYTLLDEWLPAGPDLVASREDALKALALRYFASHGPATLADFLWWSGLTAGEARAALEMAMPTLNEATFAGQKVWWCARAARPPAAGNATSPRVHLLAGFDEYVLGYTDRSAVIDAEHAAKAMTNNGLFRPTLLVNGRVAGVWQAAAATGSVTVNTTPFAPLPRKTRDALQLAAQRYAAFAGLVLAAA